MIGMIGMSVGHAALQCIMESLKQNPFRAATVCGADPLGNESQVLLGGLMRVKGIGSGVRIDAGVDGELVVKEQGFPFGGVHKGLHGGSSGVDGMTQGCHDVQCAL